MAEHSISTGHCIDFSGTSILDRTSGYVDRVVKEEIEILVHLNKKNFNIDGGFILSQSWSPISNTLMNVNAGLRGRDSVVGIVTRYGQDGPGI